MMYYYYPLSTRDFAFENIFSSESVSPALYYSKRAFGFDYFQVLAGLHSEFATILYSNPPIYQDENHSKFILKIAESLIHSEELAFISEGVFAYNATIYFDTENLEVLFFSQRDLKIAILKANTSLPTKLQDKYSPSFKLISDSDCQAYPTLSGKIQKDPELDLKIALDKRYNHFKGLLYGMVIGKIISDGTEKNSLGLHIQEITNAFAELKSRLEDQITTKRSDGSKGFHFYIEKLFQALDVAEEAHHQSTFGTEIDEQQFLEYLLTKQSRLKSIAEVSNYLDFVVATDELLDQENYQKLLDKYTRDLNNGAAIFNQVKNDVKLFISTYQSDLKQRYRVDEINNRIKRQLRDIREQHTEQSAAKQYQLSMDLNGINYDFISNEVTLIGQGYLNTKADSEYTSITNAILKFSKSNKGPAQREMILKIVEEIGNSYTKRGKETLLYQYLDNKIDVYSLDNAANLVMKNFVAFIFNPDSLEKLDKYLTSKDVHERWMAFSFWGAYNGFASISQNYTRNIFSSTNIELQNQIDGFLKKYLIMISEKPQILNRQNRQPIVEDESEITNSTRDLQIRFYNSHVLESYKLKFDEFIEVLTINDQKEFQEKLKIKYRIAKKDSLKLFTAIKKHFEPGTLFQ